MQGKFSLLGLGVAMSAAVGYIPIQAQIAVYSDYLGAGHHEGISVTTSSHHQPNGWNRHASGQRTIDGGGLDGKRVEAARFLSQAAFGGSIQDINTLAQSNDFEGWMDWQMELQATNFLTLSKQCADQAYTAHIQNGGNPATFIRNFRHFQYAWWQAANTRPDVFRQRVAQALSEIFVISFVSTIRAEYDAYGSYYDLLMKNAFGNYRDLLKEVSLHPAMGIYLTHFRNPKTNAQANTFPDENYAREILQLFSIGLVKLNPDGTVVQDANGNDVPTYGPEDIRQLAKVFTDLGAGAITQQAANSGLSVSFVIKKGNLDYTVPMKMYDAEHESGAKTILGQTIPAGLTGMQDIDEAVHIIFNHPNVGPFVAKRLIQQLVKSNPSPAYVADVSAAFDNNGHGVRGDMRSVLKAILLHDEARSCLWMTEPTAGKLRSPSMRYAQFARSLELTAPHGAYWTTGVVYESATSHLPLHAPTVFNFYQPDHQPAGPLREQSLLAPEFQILNATTAIGYANELDNWTRLDRVFLPQEFPSYVTINKGHYADMTRDPEILINHLDVLLCNGRLSHATRVNLRTALEGLTNPDTNLAQRLDLALYIMMLSPEYTILK